ncbi:hypothetical protein [Streptomyces sp. NPDC059928]|uniref:hypothetical protein n=1 Tax=unclassified Streptomyces TaxID=2593676 RepID=UPI00366285AD
MARTFPPDPVQAQRDWTRMYATLTHDPFRTALRRRLQLLSSRIARHPYWGGGISSATGRVELRRQARSVERQETRAV